MAVQVQAADSGESCAASPGYRIPDPRRVLQLILGAIWLLDGVLQFQSFMFTPAFGRMLAGAARGNPAVIADPITWAARIIEQHAVPANAAFATIQLLIGLGIACRPAIRAALAASVAWSLAVWWFGEGLGGVIGANASPVSGAPGAVILYALLAVLIWPSRDGPAGNQAAPGRSVRPGFVAAHPVGPATARALWLILWGSLAYFAVTAANRTAEGLPDLLAGMADGEPGWLGAVNRGAAELLGHHGLAASIVLAALLAVVATAVLLPAPLHRAAVVLAIVVSVLIWIAGQDLGELFTGSATDPNSGPLLVLLALAYWPLTGTSHMPGPDPPSAPAQEPPS
ncbi:MAG TPA: hypothetical protein VFQ44_22060 [Streptosporangiaceae bacterium]|nr:hypothetical protein [Streptosporangiaceae bacterium]